MKKDLKYILVLVATVIGLVLVELLTPEPTDWSFSLSKDRKIPYGTYVFKELLPQLFPDQRLDFSYHTIYEERDSAKQNFFVLCNHFSPEQEDLQSLLSMVNEGRVAFISANYFSGAFADTLEVTSADYFFSSITGDEPPKSGDSTRLSMINPRFDDGDYPYHLQIMPNYFTSFDTTRTYVIAKNNAEDVVTIKVDWGEGYLVLNNTPAIFTNIYMLEQQNHEFVSKTMAYLPQEDLHWTEYYQLGRMEASSPLRFVLSNESLSWAYYLLILALLLFILFEAKRKQRIIPIVKPLENTTLEFVQTIANLYWQQKDHTSIAQKKIGFFLEDIRVKYRLETVDLDDDLVMALSKRSGNPESSVAKVISIVNQVKSVKKVSAEQLLLLNQAIEGLHL